MSGAARRSPMASAFAPIAPHPSGPPESTRNSPPSAPELVSGMVRGHAVAWRAGFCLTPADARGYASSSNPPPHPRRTGVSPGRPSHHGPTDHRGFFVPSSARAIFLGGEVASNRSFGSPPQGTAEVPVHGLRSMGPSRLPGDPAQLGVPGHRTGLSVSRRVDPAARKVT